MITKKYNKNMVKKMMTRAIAFLFPLFTFLFISCSDFLDILKNL